MHTSLNLYGLMFLATKGRC